MSKIEQIRSPFFIKLDGKYKEVHFSHGIIYSDDIHQKPHSNWIIKHLSEWPGPDPLWSHAEIVIDRFGAFDKGVPRALRGWKNKEVNILRPSMFDKFYALSDLRGAVFYCAKNISEHDIMKIIEKAQYIGWFGNSVSFLEYAIDLGVSCGDKVHDLLETKEIYRLRDFD